MNDDFYKRDIQMLTEREGLVTALSEKITMSDRAFNKTNPRAEHRKGKQSYSDRLRNHFQKKSA